MMPPFPLPSAAECRVPERQAEAPAAAAAAVQNAPVLQDFVTEALAAADAYIASGNFESALFNLRLMNDVFDWEDLSDGARRAMHALMVRLVNCSVAAARCFLHRQLPGLAADALERVAGLDLPDWVRRTIQLMLVQCGFQRFACYGQREHLVAMVAGYDAVPGPLSPDDGFRRGVVLSRLGRHEEAARDMEYAAIFGVTLDGARACCACCACCACGGVCWGCGLAHWARVINR
jgi:hypothetical protein